MTQILSDDQIEQLVARARDGEDLTLDQAPKTRRPRRVREIDFSRPNKFTSEQQRRIERAHEAFCRTVSTQLSAGLRTPVDLEVLNVGQHTWASALAEVPLPSIFGIVEVQPLTTRMLLAVELPAIHRVIVRLLGGPSSGRVGGRDLTEIELALTRRIFVTLVGQLSASWGELMGLTFGLLDLESALPAVQLVPPSEPSLAVTIELRSEGGSSTITLIVPHRSVAPGLADLSSGHYAELEAGGPDTDAAAAVRASLADVGVELRAEIASVEMPVEALLALKPGDIIRFAAPVAAGMTLYAESVPVHRVRPGRSGKRRSVQIIERLEADE